MDETLRNEIIEATKKYREKADERDNGPNRRAVAIYSAFSDINMSMEEVKELLKARQEWNGNGSFVLAGGDGKEGEIVVHVTCEGLSGTCFLRDDEGKLISQNVPDLFEIAAALESSGRTAEMILEKFSTEVTRIIEESKSLD
jgi:hypothetical protein